MTLLHGDGSPTDLLHEVVRALELRGEVQHLLVIHFFIWTRAAAQPASRTPAINAMCGSEGGGGVASPTQNAADRET